MLVKNTHTHKQAHAHTQARIPCASNVARWHCADYYRINGELYDCFLYALFVNGAQSPGEWGWGIQSLSR